jgi:hypothetical protein
LRCKGTQFFLFTQEFSNFFSENRTNSHQM